MNFNYSKFGLGDVLEYKVKGTINLTDFGRVIILKIRLVDDAPKCTYVFQTGVEVEEENIIGRFILLGVD